jgi:acetyl-CoA acetyltransferase family protein
MVALLDTHCGLYMAQTSDALARQYGITREQMDAYALRSQKAAQSARERGVFAEEIVPVDVAQGRKTVRVDADDHPRPDTTLEALAALKPSFGKEGLVTAGNASGIVDGGAALVVAHRDEARRRGLQPLGSIVSWGVAGVPPEIMGIGPAPATRKAMEGAGLSLRDIDLVEVNEAFAGQYLAVEKELGLDRERTNVNGGAIALGHPLGATGTRLLLTVLLELRRRRAAYGLATACIGGGQGIAMIVRNEAAR